MWGVVAMLVFMSGTMVGAVTVMVTVTVILPDSQAVGSAVRVSGAGQGATV